MRFFENGSEWLWFLGHRKKVREKAKITTKKAPLWMSVRRCARPHAHACTEMSQGHVGQETNKQPTEPHWSPQLQCLSGRARARWWPVVAEHPTTTTPTPTRPLPQVKTYLCQCQCPVTWCNVIFSLCISDLMVGLDFVLGGNRTLREELWRNADTWTVGTST